jgi:hypothetical protein
MRKGSDPYSVESPDLSAGSAIEIKRQDAIDNKKRQRAMMMPLTPPVAITSTMRTPIAKPARVTDVLSVNIGVVMFMGESYVIGETLQKRPACLPPPKI